MTIFLPSWFERSSSAHRKSAARRPARPSVETLESRLMPTVSFSTAYPSTTVLSASDSSWSMLSPPVVLIFRGSSWQTGQGHSDEQTVLGSVQSILNGPYLGKLTQYGSDGHATFGGFWETTDPLPLSGGTPTTDALKAFVNTQKASHSRQVPPTPGTRQRSPIFVVINDPRSSGENTSGYNWTDGGVHAIYVGTSHLPAGGSVFWRDGFSLTFSHELAEAMVSAIRVSDPGNFNQNGGQPYGQIADNEGEYHNNGVFGFRLNGNFVQAYWSQQDHAWVVPDGSAATVTYTRALWDYRTQSYIPHRTSTTTAPAAAWLTAASVVNRDTVYVVGTDGGLWTHTGSDGNSGWTRLLASGVTGLSVGRSTGGQDAVFVNIGGTLYEHLGLNPSTGWSALGKTGVTGISASVTQADTVFVTTGSSLSEHVGTNASTGWSLVWTGSVTDLSAGVDAAGKPSVFANLTGTVYEFTGNASTWARFLVSNGVSWISASQVQADTVYLIVGGGLYYHAGLNSSTVQFASGVTGISAGVDARGKPVVFALFGSTLYEYTGNAAGWSWSWVTDGATRSSASQTAADAVLVQFGNYLEQHAGQNSQTNWVSLI